jgi:hypothetical protein
VVSDERSPKTQMRAYRGEPYQAALRCAHTALQRMPLRAPAGGAMQRGGASLQAALRCNQFRLSGCLGVLWGCSGALQQVALRCNRQCCDPTGRAALWWLRHAGVRACAQQRLPH